MKTLLIALLAALPLGDFETDLDILAGGSPAARAAAAARIAATGREEAVDALLPLLADEERETRLAVAAALGDLPAFADLIVPALAGAAADASPEELSELVWAAVRLPGPKSRAWLVELALGDHLETLATVIDTGYRNDVLLALTRRLPAGHAALVRLTGRNLGLDGEAWRRILGSVSPPEKPTRGSAPPATEPGAAGDDPEGDPGDVFYGLPLPKGDFVFVIDASASMNEETDGVALIDEVKAEVLARIEALDPKRRFNVVFFNARAEAFRRRFVHAVPGRLDEVRRWIGEVRARGGTNLGAGLACALSDRAVRDIVLLSDGRPTRGRVRTANDAMDLIGRREVRVHTVANRASASLLREIARRTGGAFGLLRAR